MAPDTTVANTCAALLELRKKGRVYKKAVVRLATDQSGVDYTTLARLQPLAKAVLAGEPGSGEALADAAALRFSELRQHKRINTGTESLRFFCGILRIIFNDAACHFREQRITAEEAWQHCRGFALAVFTAAGIKTADFDAHPERLTEYLQTEIRQ